MGKEELPSFYTKEINVADKYGNTKLHNAAYQKNNELVQLWIELKGDVSAKTNAGYTPLHFAILKGSWSIAKLLLDADAEISAQGKDGYMPIHIAASGFSAELFEKLLKYNAEIGSQDNDGCMPIHFAAAAENIEIMKLLLDKYKINVDEEDNNGWNALDYFCINLCSDGLTEDRRETIKYLLEHGSTLTCAEEKDYDDDVVNYIIGLQSRKAKNARSTFEEVTKKIECSKTKDTAPELFGNEEVDSSDEA